MGRLSEFRDIAPYLANPLILVGFALFLVFGVHRTLLRAGIIRPIPEQHSSQIVKLLLKYGFYLGLATILSGFLYAAVRAYLDAAVVRHSDLQLVDVSVDHDGHTVDFKLKNSGLDSAFLTDVVFVLYRGRGILAGCAPVWFPVYRFPASAFLQTPKNGDGISMGARRPLPPDLKARILALDLAEMKDHNYWAQEGTPFAQSQKPMKIEPLTISAPVKIAQQVPPAGVDRFKIRFQLDKGEEQTCDETEDYAMRALIRYDKVHDLISPLFFIRLIYPDKPIF